MEKLNRMAEKNETESQEAPKQALKSNIRARILIELEEDGGPVRTMLKGLTPGKGDEYAVTLEEAYRMICDAKSQIEAMRLSNAVMQSQVALANRARMNAALGGRA